MGEARAVVCPYRFLLRHLRHRSSRPLPHQLSCHRQFCPRRPRRFCLRRSIVITVYILASAGISPGTGGRSPARTLATRDTDTINSRASYVSTTAVDTEVSRRTS